MGRAGPRGARLSPGSLRGRLGPGTRLGLIAAIAAAVVALDAASKWIAIQALDEGHPVVVLGGLVRFDLYRNFAGPNNIFPGQTVAISVFALLAVAVLAVVAFRVVRTSSAVAVGLLLGGAIGNLLDRLLREPGPLRGGVVDWLRFTDRTKSMNVADLAIDAAIAVIVLTAILGWWRGERSGEDGAAAAGERESAGNLPP